MKDKIYLIGGFSGWRADFEKASPKIKFDNPLYHKQSSITKLNSDDMGSSANNASLAYIEEGKRLGTMSYSELGAARAAGMPIISVDENEIKDSILERIATYNFNSKEEVYNFLQENQELFSTYEPLVKNDKTKSMEDYKSILFTGDYKGINPGKVPSGKSIYFAEDYMDNLEELSYDVDLIVTNFNPGKKQDPQGLFFMGLGYELDIPIIELEGNAVPYPPLLGLARRVMVGENRFKQLEFYLENLGSQHISKEALVYYNLMNKFNK